MSILPALKTSNEYYAVQDRVVRLYLPDAAAARIPRSEMSTYESFSEITRCPYAICMTVAAAYLGLNERREYKERQQD